MRATLVGARSAARSQLCSFDAIAPLNGDRAHALQVYHRCMTLLREELGVDPGAIARKLYEQLLREDEVPEIQPSVQSTSGADTGARAGTG
ncbi:MAG: hypothetical protein HC942_11165, partial [Microcoleus sp. SU_5_6]|nr:hypothetical protein [Microcoleus sp. SU_5_6]